MKNSLEFYVEGSEVECQLQEACKDLCMCREDDGVRIGISSDDATSSGVVLTVSPKEFVDNTWSAYVGTADGCRSFRRDFVKDATALITLLELKIYEAKAMGDCGDVNCGECGKP